MRNYVVFLFVLLGFHSAQASCYKNALEAAKAAQEDLEYRYDEPYSGGRYYVDESENSIFVELLGSCYGADPAIVTVKVKFKELQTTCKEPNVEKIAGCLYLP